MGSRYPFPASPNGWFSVGACADLAPGDVRPVSYLGRDLVLFRGEDGAPRVFDAYCPHLGANLGVGGRGAGTELLARSTVGGLTAVASSSKCREWIGGLEPRSGRGRSASATVESSSGTMSAGSLPVTR